MTAIHTAESLQRGPAALWATMLLLAGCGGGAVSTPVERTATGGTPGVRSYVLSNIYIPASDDPGACPQLSDGAIEIFLKSLPAAQRAQYETPDRREAAMRLMNERVGFKAARIAGDPVTGATGPEQIEATRRKLGIAEGKGGLTFLDKVVVYDSCSNPEDFPQFDTGLQPFLGKTAYGMDLDGRRGEHDFTAPDGTPGVDNQLWRVLGCQWSFREHGDPKVAAGVLFSARRPTLIEISGIDDPRNDDDVSIAVYASATALHVNAQRGALAKASYDALDDARVNGHTRGRIVDGVLTTEPFDVGLAYQEQIIDSVRKLRAVRLRATLKPDGSIDGGFYGYYDLDSFWDQVRQMGQLGTSVSRISCPAVRSALKRYADGFPDPATGENTAISSALQFVGVAAHVVHRPTQVADRGTATAQGIE
jgi:hypothetical protein